MRVLFLLAAAVFALNGCSSESQAPAPSPADAAVSEASVDAAPPPADGNVCVDVPNGKCPSSIADAAGYPYGTDYNRSMACSFDPQLPCPTRVDESGVFIVCCPAVR